MGHFHVTAISLEMGVIIAIDGPSWDVAHTASGRQPAAERGARVGLWDEQRAVGQEHGGRLQLALRAQRNHPVAQQRRIFYGSGLACSTAGCPSISWRASAQRR